MLFEILVYNLHDIQCSEGLIVKDSGVQGCETVLQKTVAPHSIRVSGNADLVSQHHIQRSESWTKLLLKPHISV